MYKEATICLYVNINMIYAHARIYLGIKFLYVYTVYMHI